MCHGVERRTDGWMMAVLGGEMGGLVCPCMLTVSRTGHVERHVHVENLVVFLYGIPGCPHMGCRRSHVLIHHNGPPCAERKTSILCYVGICRNTDCENDNICFQNGTGFRRYKQNLAVVFLRERRYCIAQVKAHAMFLECSLDVGDHFAIHGGKDLVFHVDNGRHLLQMLKVFGHFQTDEPTTDYYRLVCAVVMFYPVDDFVNVWDTTNGENSWKIDTREGGDNGLCAGSKHKFVILVCPYLPGLKVLYGHGLVLGVKGKDVGPCVHIDVEPLLQFGRVGNEELVSLLDDATDVVWETTVCKRYVTPPLIHHYVAGFTVAAEPGCC
eukprot:comp22865_c0_seq1/m.36079 comp22865_c0_seq1/g.36079  ORF comp22865_c0_seq1/g.36079 comp22865_c0_seq1/m.36079 type:complete len:326 (+) comp22865_c0_seq1:1035-2012(+)